MLKLGKGLKKKIKGKKHKDDSDDLFDPDQLEKLKKELEQKRLAAAAEAGESSGGASSQPPPEDEEWAKFKALTAGVDASLKKTSEELGKIKETSFYQRQVTDPTNLWRPHPTKEEEKVVPVEEEKVETPEEEEVLPPPPPPEEEEPVEIDDSLFDTSYLDAIAAGDIHLNYIPDSDPEEEGDDPFDTSGVADVCKRIEEAEKKLSRQVNLGATVNFLSGGKKGEAPSSQSSVARPRAGADTKRARARPRAVNLLGDSENAPAPPIYQDKVKEVKKEEEEFNLLDEVLGVGEGEGGGGEDFQILISSQQTVKVQVPSKKEEEDNFKDILGEFDWISKSEEPTINRGQVSSTQILRALLEPEEELDDEFAALAAESLQKSPQPPHPEEEEEEEEPEEEDPFDTAFLAKVDPSFAEKKEVFADLSPTKHYVPTLAPTCKPSCPPPTGDLIDTPSNTKEDPFDSTLIKVVQPGKQELRLLEEELLSSNLPPLRPKLPVLPPKFSAPPVSASIEEDFDFDPRADEKPAHLFDQEEEEGDKEVKLLIPQEEEEEDPFDTSALDHLSLVPGATELKLLATELTQDIVPQQGGSSSTGLTNLEELSFKQEGKEEEEEDFDPRVGEEPDPFIVVQVLTNQDLFDTTEDSHTHKVLTPQTHSAAGLTGEHCEDPFDTSAIHLLNLLPPSELKQIEGEILSLGEEAPRKGVQLKAAFSAPPVPQIEQKPLEPQVLEDKLHLLEEEDAFHQEHLEHSCLEPLEVNFDPFDTSIAEGVVPGKTEIRILEKELQLGIDHLSGRRLSDPDFDPRGIVLPPQPVHPASLSFVSKTLEPTKLHSIDFSSEGDPFDTSSVVGDKPVRPPPPPTTTDLKALEAELL